MPKWFTHTNTAISRTIYLWRTWYSTLLCEDIYHMMPKTLAHQIYNVWWVTPICCNALGHFFCFVCCISAYNITNWHRLISHNVRCDFDMGWICAMMSLSKQFIEKSYTKINDVLTKHWAMEWKRKIVIIVMKSYGMQPIAKRGAKQFHIFITSYS